MKIELAPGKYVVAVSGGVDSVVLLDLLSNLPEVELVVAHFDHSIRPDSAKDADFVEKLAKKYNLPFELGLGGLGANASEDEARVARYKFLKSVKDKYKANAIITAHHQDDLIETAFINILRGTGYRGLAALSDNSDLRRPLLGFSKQQLLRYAKNHKLVWREDPSNQNLIYLRNYLRHKVVKKLRKDQRQDLLKDIEKIKNNKVLIDRMLADLGLFNEDKIDRQLFSLLPVSVGNEVMVDWFIREKVGEFNKKTVERANIAIRTAKAGTKTNVTKNTFLVLDSSTARLAKSK